jgi:hypothetical protein
MGHAQLRRQQSLQAHQQPGRRQLILQQLQQEVELALKVLDQDKQHEEQCVQEQERLQLK